MTDPAHHPRANEFWPIEPLLAGATVFLLASGPSLGAVDLTRLRGRRVMAVNSTCHAVLAAGIADPMLFFMDSGWVKGHVDVVEAWPGPVFTMSRAAKGMLPDLVKRIDCAHREDFVTPADVGAGRSDHTIKFGRSSGHAAVSLAIAMGAVRLVLLGYDMHYAVDPATGAARTHHHDDHVEADIEVYARDFLPAFEGWGEAAKRAGVEVLNATAGSALAEFPMVELDAVLSSS